jgi:hypothetical protein
MPSRRAVLAGLGGLAATAATPVTARPSAEPAVAWTRTYTPDDAETGLVRGVVPLADGAVLVGLAGEQDRYRGWLARVDAAGRARWQRRVGPAGTALLDCAPAASESDTVAAAGVTNDGNEPIEPSYADPYLLRADADGDHTGATYQPGAVRGSAAAITRVDDGYLLAGGVEREDGAGRRPWATRTDATGTRQWAWHGNARGTANAAVETTEGVVLAGSIRDTAADTGGETEDAWVAALGPTGERAWTWRTDRAGGDRIEALVPAADGGVLAVGRRGFAADDRGVGWTVRFDAAGDERWTRTYPQERWNWHHAAAPLETGYVLAGTRQAGPEVADRGAWLLWLDETGRVVREYQAPAGTRGFAVTSLADGGLLVGGGVETPNDDVRRRAWLAKLGGDAPRDGGAGAIPSLPSVPGWVAPLLAGGALGAVGTRLAARRRSAE